MLKTQEPTSNVKNRLFSNSISKMMLIAFTIAVLFPGVFVITALKKHSIQQVVDESYESQRLLSESLISPIEYYIQTNTSALNNLSELLLPVLNSENQTESLIKTYLNENKNSLALSLLKTEEDSVVTLFNPSLDKEQINKIAINKSTVPYVLSEKKYRQYDLENGITSAQKSMVSKDPIVVIRQQIIDSNNEKKGTLLVELELSYLQEICAKIRFGKDGQCLILDDDAQFIAAKNKKWVANLERVKNESLLHKLKVRKTGSFSHLSDLYSQELITGFSRVPSLDWKILVSRPKYELEGASNDFIKSIISWGLIGFLLSLLFVWRMSAFIVSPLENLVTKSKELTHRSDSFSLGEVPKNSPMEIRVLWEEISTLIKNFQDADKKANALTKNSANDVRKIVVDFRIKNLKKAENIDTQLGVTTIECFKKELGRALIVNKKLNVGVIQFSIDNFAELSSTWNKKITTNLLQHVGMGIKNNIRGSDMVARIDQNTGQFIVYINSLYDKENLEKISKKLFSNIQRNPYKENGEEITSQLSMGMVNHTVTLNSTTKVVMEEAELALNEFRTKRSKALS